MELKGKRILFLTADFFGYNKEIYTVMVNKGVLVDYFDERPANTFIVKAMIRVNRNLLARYIDNYHRRIIEETKEKNYDYIFFIKGESIANHTITCLRHYHPSAKIIIYHWDSISNNPNALNLLPFFDKVYSFDKPDCQKLGIRFLPLFYLDDYSKIVGNKSNFDYDLLFVGTTHSDRYQFVKNIESQLKEYGGKSFIYFFFPSKILYYKMKLQNKYLRNTSVKDFHFEAMDKTRLLQLYEASRVIVDVQHPRQTGLTMRCIETLGARRKLITTNQHIKKYDFYCKENILAIDRERPVITKDFLLAPYRELPEDVYHKYSLENWLSTIFQE